MFKSKKLNLHNKKNKEIYESEKKYKDLANFLPQTVFELDKSGKFTFINDAGLKLTGYNKFDINNGLNIEKIITPDDRQRYREDILYILEGGKNKGQEYIALHKNGSSFPVSTYISPISNSNKESVGLRGIIIDITEQKSLERKLLSSVIETEDKERKRFSEDLHDGLGPLLSTINLYFNQINSGNIDKNEKIELTKYTNELIEEAISSTRTIANNLMPGTISDKGLIAALNSFCEKLNFTKTICVDFKNSNINQRYSIAIETAIYRVIIELINNTIKHAKANNIEISLEEKNNFLLLKYHDDGIGFNINEILNKKQGLGLNNVLNRAKSINGKCFIDSGKKIGTTINVDIDLSGN